MDKINQYIHGVSVHPCASVAACVEDGGADVSGKGIRLGG